MDPTGLSARQHRLGRPAAVVNPPNECRGLTYFNDDKTPYGFYRTATLPGSHDLGPGDRVAVVGRLRVLTHPAGVIDGRLFR